MSDHRREVRAQVPNATVEFRVSAPKRGRDFSHLGYWAVVVRGPGAVKLLGRGEDEVAAWGMAASTLRMESILETIDYQPNSNG